MQLGQLWPTATLLIIMGFPLNFPVGCSILKRLLMFSAKPYWWLFTHSEKLIIFYIYLYWFRESSLANIWHFSSFIRNELKFDGPTVVPGLNHNRHGCFYLALCSSCCCSCTHIACWKLSMHGNSTEPHPHWNINRRELAIRRKTLCRFTALFKRMNR